jgi:hypothetical protein
MADIQRDRDGTIYRLDGSPMPPPSSETHANRLFYELSSAYKVINDLLDRVYILEARPDGKTLPESQDQKAGN